MDALEAVASNLNHTVRSLLCLKQWFDLAAPLANEQPSVCASP